VQSSVNLDIPLVIKAYLAKVGIQADLEILDIAPFMATINSTWHNALIYYPLIQWPNPNVGFNFYFGSSGTLFQSLKKPDGWSDLLNNPSTAPAANPAPARECEDALYNDATIIPLVYQASLWATTGAVKDAFIGTRGTPPWWEPQSAWLGQAEPLDAPIMLNPSTIGPLGIGRPLILEPRLT
jgi:ABC-type transport system substrate-binding protein